MQEEGPTVRRVGWRGSKACSGRSQHVVCRQQRLADELGSMNETLPQKVVPVAKARVTTAKRVRVRGIAKPSQCIRRSSGITMLWCLHVSHAQEDSVTHRIMFIVHVVDHRGYGVSGVKSPVAV